MTEIPLRKRDGTLVGYAQADDADVAALSAVKWHLTAQGYACNGKSVKQPDGSWKAVFILMHRFIMAAKDPKGGLEVDHINGNKLDNRRCNLRLCTRQENSRNRAPMNGHVVNGVHRFQNGWRARICPGGNGIHLGCFVNHADAVAARRAGELKYFGEFARSAS